LAELTIRIEESEEYGLSLHVSDYEVGDAFDDWMIEQWGYFYEFLDSDDGMTFLFGKASDAAKIKGAYQRFELETRQPVAARDAS
jgi:hypothetical protein